MVNIDNERTNESSSYIYPTHLRLHLPTPIKCFTHVSPLYMTHFIPKVSAFLMTKHIEVIPRNGKSFSILQTVVARKCK